MSQNKIRHPGESRDPSPLAASRTGGLFLRSGRRWVPAFAGMTVLGVALALSSCVPIIVGGVAAGAGAGAAAEREGGLESATNDTRIKALLDDKYFEYNTEVFRKLHTTVDEGRVLITGIVQTPEDRVAAVRLAWQVEGVVQVINEIQIADSQDFGSYAQDKWITARLKTELTFTKDIKSDNYSVDTVNGIVYLMGIAENKDELDTVIDIARQTPHVKQVISYVKMQGEPIPGPGAGRIETKPAGSAGAPDNSLPYDHAGSGGGPSTPASTSTYSPLPASPADDTTGPPQALAPVQSESLQPQPVQREELH